MDSCFESPCILGNTLSIYFMFLQIMITENNIDIGTYQSLSSLSTGGKIEKFISGELPFKLLSF